MYTVIIVIDIKGVFQIYTLDSDRSTLAFSAGLFKTLKELFLIGRCAYHCSLEMLLNALPALTHVTYKLEGYHDFRPSEDYDSINSEIHRNIQSSNDDDNHNYNLVFLCLHSTFRSGHQIEKIIKRCPRLEYLLAPMYIISGFHEQSPLDFPRILQICPSIRYIHRGTITVSSKLETKWLTLSRRQNTDNKDNSSDYEKMEGDHLRQVDFSDDNENQHISTLKACLRQPLLEHLGLSGMFGVDLHQLCKSLAQDNGNLLLQPSPLRSLKLVEFCIPGQTENDMSFQDLFSHFQHIERLKMLFFVNPIRTLEAQGDCMSQILEAIGDQLYQLRYLFLDASGGHFCDSRMVVCNNLSATLCDGNQNLKLYI